MENGTEAHFITKLHIQHFKSIRDIEIPCKRVNVLIGEPNTGKSNILEALGVFSALKYGSSLDQFVRLEHPSDLFHHADVERDVLVDVELESGVEMGYKVNYDFGYNLIPYPEEKERERGLPSNDWRLSRWRSIPHHIKSFQFNSKEDFSSNRLPLNELVPPHGSNLPFLLKTNNHLRELIGLYFHQYDLKLVIKPQANILELQKEQDGIAITYPYKNVSDTLRRMVFFVAAIESSKHATLCFEEPAAFSFPGYAKELGEKIARDDDNQYFLATHNPYILANVVEKTAKEDIQVIVTYYDKASHETRIHILNPEEIIDIIDMGASAFFNLDTFQEPV